MTRHITEQEVLYKKLVTGLICSKEGSVEEKNYMLFNFLNQADFYYDVFCDSVFSLMADDSVETLSLDTTGYARSNFIRTEDDSLGYELLKKEDILSSEDDVIIYINLALERLRTRLKNKESSLIIAIRNCSLL